MLATDPIPLVVQTPIGALSLSFQDGAVRAARFLDSARVPPHAAPGARALHSRLRAYFEGDPDALLGIAVEPGGTTFQRAVWDALRRIPAGEVRSYSELARGLGRAGAARAVGAACARNPVALVVPCHRAVGADGSLTGYAFGLERKRWLLVHEAARRGNMAGTCSASAGLSPSSWRR